MKVQVEYFLVDDEGEKSLFSSSIEELEQQIKEEFSDPSVSLDSTDFTIGVRILRSF